MIIRAVFAMVALTGSAAIAGDRAAPIRDVPIGGMIAATIDGKPLTLRVDPAAPGLPLVSTATAERLALRAGGIGLHLGYVVGKQSVMHQTTVRPMTLGDAPVKRRIGFPMRPKSLAAGAPWQGHAYALVGDGTIGPGALPEPIVRIALRAPRAGERTVALPLVDGGGMFGRFSGEFAQILIGGVALRVRFDPYHPRTTVTANAATLIADAQGGKLTGVTEPVEIAFGITRPVRTMTLATPLAIGPISLSSLGVRTADVGSATAIPDADATPDPDEIVVTAKGKRDPKRDRLTLGADVLDRCSAIVFDQAAKQVRLTCG
jgi:hypothetical protein